MDTLVINCITSSKSIVEGGVVKTKFKIDTPGSLQATLSITMSIEEWKRVYSQMSQSWPSGDIRRIISDMLDKALKEFDERSEEA